MEKIEINEENYMEYQDFLNSKMGLPKKHLILWAIGIAILVLATAIGIMVGAVLIEELVWGIIGKFFPIKATSNILIPELIRWMSFSAFSMGSAFLGLKAVLSITMGYIPMKMFQKKHPDFDINIICEARGFSNTLLFQQKENLIGSAYKWKDRLNFLIKQLTASKLCG